MSSVGLDQRVIAKDGYPLAATRSVVALNIAPGQTQDALIGIPPTAAGKFALLDSNLFLHNSGLDGFGGMMAFINLGTTTPPPARTSNNFRPVDAKSNQRHGRCSSLGRYPWRYRR